MPFVAGAALVACLVSSVAVAAGLVCWNVRGHLRGGRTRSWSSTEGSVVGARTTGDQEGWLVEIEYRYVVDGSPYLSRSYAVTGLPSFAGYQAAQQFEWAHPTGTPVTVFYDPEDPAESLLKRGGPSLTITALSYLVAGCGLWLAWVCWKALSEL